MEYKNKKTIYVDGYLVDVLSNDDLGAESLRHAEETIRKLVDPSHRNGPFCEKRDIRIDTNNEHK